ncbi:hypothetical protein [Pseudomonas sp. GL-RE-19]|uniref:hypothetical protein n=1 Tax=Pseudomonas sp. GL-RE-19 TaxID=2832389 RepID=UPI0029589CCF|nr:hypothetical protein [Pseudomonas sp. GL-RE-19]
MHVSSTPVFDAQDQVEHVVIVLTDITQSKLHEVLQNKVIGASLQKSSFRSSVSTRKGFCIPWPAPVCRPNTPRPSKAWPSAPWRGPVVPQPTGASRCW